MNRVRFFFVILCVCLAFQLVKAEYRFDQWTTDNGLPQNSVRRILQTSDGYIWFTTLDGLVRFDGVKFKVFNKSNYKNLPSNRFINLFAEADDTLWICTEEHGLVRFRNGEFKNFTTADGLPSNTVFELTKQSDGKLLAFTNTSATQFDGVRFTQVSTELEEKQFKLFAAPSGNFWEINKNSLILIKNGQKSIFDLPANIKEALGLISNLFETVRLFEDQSGDLWFTTNNGNSNFLANKLFKFSAGKFQEISAEDLPQSIVFDIEQDRSGNLWLATQKEGVCRLKENKFTCYTAENRLSSKTFRNFFKDREGNLWIATNDAGIFRLTEQVITSLSTNQGLEAKNVYAVFENKNGVVWVGSYDGLAEYRNGVFKNYRYEDGLIYGDVQSIFEDKNGRLWIGSLNGIEYFENGKFHDFKKNLGITGEDTGVFGINQDKEGFLWFATNIGLIKYDGTNAEILTTKDGLPGNNVKTIVINDDNSLWLGTYDGIALLKDGKFTSYTEKDGLAGNHVRAIFKDENETLWIGTYDSGLSRFKDGKFTNYSVENGLSSNGVFQILEDSDKNFWMSSNQGIYRVSRKQLDEFAEGKRQSVTSTLFGKSDGMLNTEANGGGKNSGMKTRDGRLWFSTQDGVAVINPELVKVNNLPPPVVIENARIDNQNIENFQNKIEMIPGQENLEIDYTGLSFIKPEQVNFRYRLEGYDENWTEAGNRRTAFFPHLAPGNYTFHVIAANSDNVWNEQGATIEIIVKPPFYQHWLFYIICAVVLSFIIYGLFKMRLSRLERAKLLQEEFSRRLINAHETERRRIATELHDSIGQSLAMIKNRAFLSAETATDEKTKKQLEQITAQTTQTISEVREISYALRPYLLENLGLTKTIKSLLNKITETGNLHIESEIDEIDGLFDAEAEMSIYRIIQESLSNIIKHAEASEIQVFVKKSERNLTVLISDDGKGFEPDAVKIKGEQNGGFGLLGMSERVKMLGGTREIESEIGGGTTILIKIPLRDLTKKDER